MSKRSVCAATGKSRYPSRGQAHIAMRHASNKVRVYVCHECGQWHVSGQEREKERWR